MGRVSRLLNCLVSRVVRLCSASSLAHILFLGRLAVVSHVHVKFFASFRSSSSRHSESAGVFLLFSVPPGLRNLLCSRLLIG